MALAMFEVLPQCIRSVLDDLMHAFENYDYDRNIIFILLRFVARTSHVFQIQSPQTRKKMWIPTVFVIHRGCGETGLSRGKGTNPHQMISQMEIHNVTTCVEPQACAGVELNTTG